MTDCKTHYITKVVNTMKYHQKKMLNDYLEHGEFREIPKEQFWQSPIHDNDEIDTTYIDDEFL